MFGSSKVCWVVIVLLLIVIGVAGYKVIVVGETEVAEDGRVAIVLKAGERRLVLEEMRTFLSGIQTITEALTKDDMQTVAKTAHALGRAASQGVPVQLMGKLPLEFKTLGFSVHGDFDQMALDAESLGDSKHTLSQLSATLQKCVACHVAYQLRSDAFPALKK